MTKPVHYYFISTFLIDAPCANVFETISDMKGWKVWWKAIKKTSLEKKEGREVISFTIGHVGYYLSFFIPKNKIVINDREISFEVFGDVEGIGRILCNNSSSTHTTTVSVHWDNQTNKKWMNTWAPVLSWFFVLAHNLAMREFANGLARKLHAKVLSIEHAIKI